MLKRKAEKVLLDWMNGNEALLITGARQVGKVLYLPIYIIMLFKRTAPKSTTITLDLSTLNV